MHRMHLKLWNWFGTLLARQADLKEYYSLSILRAKAAFYRLEMRVVDIARYGAKYQYQLSVGLLFVLFHFLGNLTCS